MWCSNCRQESGVKSTRKKEKTFKMFGSIAVGGIFAAGNLGGVQSSRGWTWQKAAPETGAHLRLWHLMSIYHTSRTFWPDFYNRSAVLFGFYRSTKKTRKNQPTKSRRSLTGKSITAGLSEMALSFRRRCLLLLCLLGHMALHPYISMGHCCQHTVLHSSWNLSNIWLGHC